MVTVGSENSSFYSLCDILCIVPPVCIFLIFLYATKLTVAVLPGQGFNFQVAAPPGGKWYADDQF